jgi:two-component system OmpR family sensor kinase
MSRFSARAASRRERFGGLSLRSRLLAILLVLLAIALAATGYVTQYVLRGALIGNVDADLSRPSVERLLNGPQFTRANGPPSGYVLRWAADGDAPRTWLPANRPPGLTAVPDFPELTAEQARQRQGTPFVLSSQGSGPRWRAMVYGVNDTDGYVIVALPLDRVDAAVGRVRLALLLFGLLAAGGCALLGWLAIRRAFAPLVEVEGTAAAIAAGDLSRRVPERPAGTEVGRLTASLNGMLSQIETAFRAREASEARTRRFASDASHELRTPLASIRGYAELYRQGAVTEPDDVARTMRRVENEATRMGSLVEDLLLLARLDEQRPTRREPVDLTVLAGDAVHDARALDAQRAVRLVGLQEGAGPASALVTGDEDRLRQVVANLVANAIRHTPPNCPVEVAVGVAAADGAPSHLAVLEVRDHGPGLGPDQVDRVFERFYRVDASRSRGTGGGSGLGLSIVAAVVAAHGGTVGVRPTPGGGATFQVTLPGRQLDAPDDEVPDDEGAVIPLTITR